MPPVFLSYARADAQDVAYFEKFYSDLLKEIRLQLGRPNTDGLIFRDGESIALGAQWEKAIAEALASSNVFLAMVSRTYLGSTACRSEWAAFEWRMRNHGGADPQMLVPIMWSQVPIAELPPAVARLQFSAAALGPTYAKGGVRAIVDANNTEYFNFRTALGVRLADLVRANALPQSAAVPGPAGLQNPFVAGPAIASPAGRELLPAGGPRHVEFLVVAAQPNELPQTRTARDGYRSVPRDWCPYLPQHDQSIGWIVQGVAHGEGLTSDLPMLTPDLVAHLERAQRNNTIAIFVVDVWSLKVQTYQTFMQSFDRKRFANAAVIVLWNEHDGETPRYRTELMDALSIAFPNLTVVKDPPTFHEAVEAPGKLDHVLRATLHEVRRRIAAYGAVMRRAEGDGPASAPHVSGPGQNG